MAILPRVGDQVVEEMPVEIRVAMFLTMGLVYSSKSWESIWPSASRMVWEC